MSDEIKEILDNIKNKYEDYYIQDILSNDDLKLLLDYITNLQQDNEVLQDILKTQHEREYASKFFKEFQEEKGTNVFPDYDEVYKRYDKLKQENERLTNELKSYKNLIKVLKSILNYEVEQYPNYDEGNYSYYVKTTLQRVLEEITALEGTYIGKDK